MSLLTGIVLGVLFGFIVRIRDKYIKYSIQVILLISVWFYWNYTVFVERESSWSTYLFYEEMSYITHFSVFPMLVLCPITLFVIWRCENNLRNENRHDFQKSHRGMIKRL